MRINSNIASLQAQRNLSTTTKALARALEKLSTGRRINRAGDDAAGLAIAGGLEAQTRSLVRSMQNLNEAEGFLYTADGAIQTQTDIVQRMRELAVQAASQIVSATDRSNLEKEFQSLLEEFNRIATQAEFNGSRILDGTLASQSIQVGSQKDSRINFSVSSSRAVDIFQKERGDGTFAESSLISGGADFAYFNLIAADINKDGRNDAISTTDEGKVSILIGNGDGTFQNEVILDYVFDPNMTRIHIADVNEDGNLDILGTDYLNSTMFVHLGSGTGTFSSAMTRSLDGLQGGYGSLADINNDGHLDYVGPTGDDIDIYFGHGDGTFGDPITINDPVDSWVVKTMDLNNDGNLDIVTDGIGFGSRLAVHLGNGDGTFAAPTIKQPAPSYASEILSADLNGDNKLDVVVGDGASAQVWVYFGNGDGTLQNATTYSISDGWEIVGLSLADFDEDGDLDILASSWGAPAILMNDGSGGFTETQRLQNFTLGSVALADFDGNNVLDIVGFGANSFEIRTGNYTEVSALSDMSISTQERAVEVLRLLDGALDRLLNNRREIGSTINRISSAASSTAVTREMLEAAKSQILDADLALETAELTRNQVLQQAQIMTLSQANLNLRNVLQLLAQ